MANEGALWIDGKPYKWDDLTIGEKNRARNLLWQIAPGNELENAGPDEINACAYTVLRQRTEPEFTLDDCFEMKSEDLVKRPPTRARAKAK
jgi:hypothetical protein